MTLVSAALLPSAPLLVPELCGQRPPLPELREAVDRAVAELLGSRPGVVTVVGPAPDTATWPADTPVDLGVLLGAATTGPPGLPLPLGLGTTALRTAGYAGETRVRGVADDLSPGACAALGRELAAVDGRVALLVVGGGSACRTEKAPGWFDPRAAGFDAGAERAVAAGDPGALLDLDPDLARALRADGRAAWQVLAGAAGDATWTSRVHYAGAPFGVGYLVAALRAG